jgi:hypothetical protein
MEQNHSGDAGLPGILAEIDSVIARIECTCRLCELSAEQPGLADLRSAGEEMKSLRERVALELAGGKETSVKDLEAITVAFGFFESLVRLIRSFVNYLFSQRRVRNESWVDHRAVATSRAGNAGSGRRPVRRLEDLLEPSGARAGPAWAQALEGGSGTLPGSAPSLLRVGG